MIQFCLKTYLKLHLIYVWLWVSNKFINSLSDLLTHKNLQINYQEKTSKTSNYHKNFYQSGTSMELIKIGRCKALKIYSNLALKQTIKIDE